MKTLVLNSPLLHLYALLYSALKRHRKLTRPVLRILIGIVGKKPLNIILADDDSDDREIFLEALGEIAPQVNVTICKDGAQLMKSLFKKKQELPDLIFLDLNMPLKTGYECLKEIRRNEGLQNIPIIIYSTSVNKDHIQETFLNGANFYFPKPDSFDDLKLVMRKIFDFRWSEFMKPQKSKFLLSINKLR